MSDDFTPGPWRAVCGDMRTAPHYVEAVAGAPAAVAEVSVMQGPEGWANARLIASAPDLLDALKILSTVKEEQIKGARGGVLFLSVPTSELQIAWKAIAKAEGR